MNKVWQILKAKGNQVWTIAKDATVLDALKLMTEKGISALVVMDGDAVAGIFTEKDNAKKVGARERQPRDTRVGEVMSQDLITVSPDQSVNEVMAIMTEKRIRHIPVFEDGRLVGLISIGDVVKDMIEELQFMVKQLENYITGLR
jgi:CBS domain-containing protein